MSRIGWWLAGGVALVPFALAVDAFDQTAMLAETSLPPAVYRSTQQVEVPADPPLITSPATVRATPDRGVAIQVEQTVAPPPPPSAREVCNSLTYIAYDPGPSGLCFRAVTAERGWSAERTASWFPFIVSEFSGVIQGESGHCWNVRRNEIIEAGEVCNEANKTRIGPLGDDTGFGQVTAVWWGRSGVLCKSYGYCGPASILASPYDSMLASIVIPVELEGSQPWCYSSHAHSYHQCWEAPDR